MTGRSRSITGASRGIGRAIAVEFAKRGADVALLGRDVAALEETAGVCALPRAPAPSRIVFTADVTESGVEVEAVVAETMDAIRAHRLCGRERRPVGRFAAAAPQGRDDRPHARRQPQIRVLSLRRRRETDDEAALRVRSSWSRSIVGITGNAGQAAYAASKAGLLGLCKSVAKELGSRNIRVNAVAPGLIETAMTEKMPDAARESLTKQAALGRPGTPEDVSGAVAFLCSDAAGYITGQTLVVDGGVVM